MCECTNGCCTDEEMAEARHGLSRRERLRNDPDYGDWMYEQKRDRKMEAEDGQMGRCELDNQMDAEKCKTP